MVVSHFNKQKDLMEVTSVAKPHVKQMTLVYRSLINYLSDFNVFI